ncbi:MAG TPA: beta-N-acetylglucosaminidase domain-containing protein, partial [Verrucomicrobiae bacterium]|nr:beta-N-acetylglucosaminidase domain-containing protein [Verrucomicrobiae bacterium]
SRPPAAWANDWWLPLSDETKSAYAQVIQACQAQGITYCFCMNPQLDSSRPLVATNLSDIASLYQHYAWAQSQGVKWFGISLDDVSWSGQGFDDAFLVNTILHELRQQDPTAQMIFTPGPYFGDGTGSAEPYLQALAMNLDPDVYIFWTGDGVVNQHITYSAAQSYRNIVQHRLFLWDNYPVNDATPTMHLGPLSGRDTNLCNVIAGYMSNPMSPQDKISRLPLATCADYAFNPWLYDPARSIGQSILLFGQTPAQQAALQDLIEAYPGFTASGGGTSENEVRDQYESLGSSGIQARDDFMAHMKGMLSSLQTNFPTQFLDAQQTVSNDIAWMGSGLGPRLVGTASVDGRQVTLRFSNGVNAASATNPANYRVVGASVLSGQLMPAPDTNILVLTTSPLAGISYTLTGSKIEDANGNAGFVGALGRIEGFSVANIGTVSAPGAMDASCDASNWIIYTRGDDIFGSADGFNFLYKSVAGDFDKVLRIKYIAPKNGWTRGGLMVRQDTSPGSPNLMVGTYQDGNGSWITSWRASNGGATDYKLAPRSISFPTNAWVRLVRNGSNFFGYYSTTSESTNWSLISSNNLALPNIVLVGLASSAIDNAGGGSAQVKFQFSDFGDSPPPSLHIILTGSTAVLTWPATGSAGFVLQESAELGANSSWSLVTNIPALIEGNEQATVPIGSATRLYRLSK